ncbi:MAG: RnfABCDGE type electron transport complex subunit A [Eubacteriales bacterium]|jgi:electron transport complex protein RnfA|nr:RnfABCDGE type electron transport complex subunit A [Eubacteriales bacterium]MDY2983268.1 RnfABCDGE type electron transport complex subunit A [Eubacteriales bacterium]
MMLKLLAIFFTMVLTENYVLVQFIAICPFLGVSKNLDSSIGMSGAVIFVMTMASAVTWVLYTYVLVPFHLQYLQTIMFILVIAALVQLVEIVLKRFIKPLYNALGIYLPLITTNCAVLAVTLLNIENTYTFAESCMDGFAAGVGFGLAMVLFCGVRRSLEYAKPPKCFEGLPITLVAAALTSITFMGFTGMAEHLFG